jgi:hypothetical protein
MHELHKMHNAKSRKCAANLWAAETFGVIHAEQKMLARICTATVALIGVQPAAV